METASIGDLQQHAVAVIAEVVAGQTIMVTDRGRPVAQITPLSRSPYERMLAAGLIRPASRRLRDLPRPRAGAAVAPVLEAMRDDERY